MQASGLNKVKILIPFLAVMFFVALCLCWSDSRAKAQKAIPKQDLTDGELELRRRWNSSRYSPAELSEAVNQCFTNGTPIRRIIHVLGTDFSRVTPYSMVSVDGSKVHCWLDYKCREESVAIYTTAELGQEPTTANFTGAGYSVALNSGPNFIQIGR